MADPVQVTCSVSPCTVQLSFNDPVFAMDTQDAGFVAAAIVGVWAVAFGFRVVIRTLRHTDESGGGQGED